MKNMYLIIVLTLAMSFLLMPLLAVEQAEKEGADSTVGTSSIKEKENTESEDFEPLNEIKLYLKDEDKIESIDSEEYILGVVAAILDICKTANRGMNMTLQMIQPKTKAIWIPLVGRQNGAINMPSMKKRW